MECVFETERLAARELLRSDFKCFHAMQSDDIVMLYTTGSGFCAEENRRQLEDCIERHSKPNNNFWVFAVVEKSTNQFVGTCAIVPNEGVPEIGYRLLREFWGNGYGQEICDGLIQYGTAIRRLPEIIAYVDTRNVASRKILDRSLLTFVNERPNSDGGNDRLYRWQAKNEAGD